MESQGILYTASNRMRIGIDCRTILSPETGEQAGTAHYTYELVRHLFAFDQDNTYVLFFDSRVKTIGYHGGPTSVLWGGRTSKNVEIIFLPFSRWSRRLPLLTTHVFLANALTRARLDLFHSPAHPLPLFYRGKMIYTVHDLAIYDHPEWFPGSFLSRKTFSTRLTVPRSIQNAAKLIAVSEATKRDILRIFRVPEEKVRVIYEGAPEIDQNGKIKNQNDNTKFKNYFLFIGTIEPRKNLVCLIDAFIHFSMSFKFQVLSFKLILAGGKGWNNDEIFMAIERANLKLGKGSVQYLGYVSQEEKIALLQHACAFVWPSLYEGFGLPILEAMATGTPVITSNTSSMPEVAGDAALLVSPESVREIALAMERIAADATLREQLKTRGLARAKQFSWERTAKETLAVYKNFAE